MIYTVYAGAGARVAHGYFGYHCKPGAAGLQGTGYFGYLGTRKPRYPVNQPPQVPCKPAGLRVLGYFAPHEKRAIYTLIADHMNDNR